MMVLSSLVQATNLRNRGTPDNSLSCTASGNSLLPNPYTLLLFLDTQSQTMKLVREFSRPLLAFILCSTLFWFLGEPGNKARFCYLIYSVVYTFGEPIDRFRGSSSLLG